MDNTITKALNDKRILIFGYGREGKSTERFIKEHCSVKSLDVFEGKREDIDEGEYDLIIKSPGIVMLEDNPKYTSQTELFLNEFSGKTVGITGTKGKSTTSAMLAHTLKYCGKSCVLLGNIGKPCFDMIDEIGDDTVIVFELSCHQLLHIGKAPHIAVFLNLFEEHLDYYKTFENYFNAKANIISHQKSGDYAITGENVPDIISPSEKTVITAPHTDYSLNVLGEHNKLNAEFVFYIANRLFNIDEHSIIEGLKSFTGLSHRLEYFGTFEGIKFYDDSISTIPEACISAVQCVPDAKTVIVGGMDRGIDYSVLVDFIKNKTDVFFVLCYETGEKIFNCLNDTCTDARGFGGNNEGIVENNDDADEIPSYVNYNYTLVKNLDEAVAFAKRMTPKGRAVILSPAAPSYGYFKDFEERGEYFKELCRA